MAVLDLVPEVKLLELVRVGGIEAEWTMLIDESVK